MAQTFPLFNSTQLFSAFTNATLAEEPLLYLLALLLVPSPPTVPSPLVPSPAILGPEDVSVDKSAVLSVFLPAKSSKSLAPMEGMCTHAPSRSTCSGQHTQRPHPCASAAVTSAALINALGLVYAALLFSESTSLLLAAAPVAADTASATIRPASRSRCAVHVACSTDATGALARPHPHCVRSTFARPLTAPITTRASRKPCPACPCQPAPRSQCLGRPVCRRTHPPCTSSRRCTGGQPPRARQPASTAWRHSSQTKSNTTRSGTPRRSSCTGRTPSTGRR